MKCEWFQISMVSITYMLSGFYDVYISAVSRCLVFLKGFCDFHGSFSMLLIVSVRSVVSMISI